MSRPDLCQRRAGAPPLTPPGATPGGVLAEQVQLRAEVRAIDPEARTVMLNVPAGGQNMLKGREGVDLTKVRWASRSV